MTEKFGFLLFDMNKLAPQPDRDPFADKLGGTGPTQPATSTLIATERARLVCVDVDMLHILTVNDVRFHKKLGLTTNATHTMAS